jgi:hypothetical protein
VPANIARIALRVVGLAVLVCAGLGLLYNSASFYAVATGALDTVQTEKPMPYLYQAFYVLSAVCVACYIALAICGIQFLRLSTSLIWLLVGVFIVEAIMWFATGRFWSHPTYGHSVAAATGISQGGLVPQFFILLPLWAPVVVWLARRSLVRA